MKLIPLIILLTSCQYVTKHESKDAGADLLGDVFPGCSLNDFFDIGSVYPEDSGQLSMSHLVGFKDGSDQSNLIGINFGVMVSSSTHSRSMSIAMPHVFFRGNPSEILNSVIAPIPIQVGAVVFKRPRTNECFQHSDMDFFCESFLIEIVEQDLSVAVSNGSLDQPRNLPGRAVVTETSYVTEIRGFIKALKTGYFFPYFIHGESLA